MTTNNIILTPTTKEPEISQALAASSAFNLKVRRDVFKSPHKVDNRRWDEEGGKVEKPNQLLQHAFSVVSQMAYDVGADIQRKWKN